MTESTAPQDFINQKALDYSGLLVTALVCFIAAYSVANTPVFVYVAILGAVQFLLFFTALRVEPQRLLSLLFWLQAPCIAALMFLVPSSFVVILTMVWLVQAVELYGIRGTLPLWLASLGVFVFAQIVHIGIDNWLPILIDLFMYGLLQMFAISVMSRSLSDRQRREQTAMLNRELIATRELLSQSSAQGERLRIARDLHDILGHHMTALILNLEVASHSVQGEPKEKVEQSLALAKLLLSDLRSTVSELREESGLNLEESIKKLVAGIPNFSIEVDFSNAPQIDDVDLAETFLRCAQEGVTNVLRHSNASNCRIVLSGSPERCTLSVIDNGESKNNIEPGNGMNGMIERVKSRGGDIYWQQGADGFQLNVTLGIAAA